MKELANKIVAVVEKNLKNRRGISWDNLEDESAIEELRQSVSNDIEKFLIKEKKDEENR